MSKILYEKFRTQITVEVQINSNSSNGLLVGNGRKMVKELYRYLLCFL